jgi:hypothetical protein
MIWGEYNAAVGLLVAMKYVLIQFLDVVGLDKRSKALILQSGWQVLSCAPSATLLLLLESMTEHAIIEHNINKKSTVLVTRTLWLTVSEPLHSQ